MSIICQDCGSMDIGYDAIVDKYGDPVIFVPGECLDCGSTNFIEEYNA